MCTEIYEQFSRLVLHRLIYAQVLLCIVHLSLKWLVPADFTPLFSHCCVDVCLLPLNGSCFASTVNNFALCRSEWRAMRQIMRVCEFMLRFSG